MGSSASRASRAIVYPTPLLVTRAFYCREVIVDEQSLPFLLRSTQHPGLEEGRHASGIHPD